MRKAELHVHLEGSIEPETLLQIDSSLTREEIVAHMPHACTFEAFIESYIWINRRISTPEHYALATRHLLARLAAQEVSYAEITLSAGVILWKKQDLPAIFDAIWAECQRSPVRAYWILDAVRHFGVEAAWPVANFAVSRLGRGVVALGLGGAEYRGPAEWYGDVFRFAREGGLHLVAHAGETVGAESVWAALSIGAERLGHGVTAVQDERLLEELKARNIPIEVCISSNVCTGVVGSVAEHPVRRLFDAGVPIVLNTDDPAMFFTSLNREYEIAGKQFGLPVEVLAENAFRYGFAS